MKPITAWTVTRFQKECIGWHLLARVWTTSCVVNLAVSGNSYPSSCRQKHVNLTSIVLLLVLQGCVMITWQATETARNSQLDTTCCTLETKARNWFLISVWCVVLTGSRCVHVFSRTPVMFGAQHVCPLPRWCTLLAGELTSAFGGVRTGFSTKAAADFISSSQMQQERLVPKAHHTWGVGWERRWSICSSGKLVTAMKSAVGMKPSHGRFSKMLIRNF